MQRRVGGFVVQEARSLAYPFFPDIRDNGLDKESGAATSLGRITFN